MRSDAHVLVHRAERAYHCPLFHSDMSRQRGAVDQHGVIADYTVMPNVGIRHDKRVVADTGDAPAFQCAAVDGDVLADHVAVADFQSSGLAVISNVLRVATDHRKREDLVIGA